MILAGVSFSQQQYLKGYYKKLSGEDFTYHSPQPDASKSLLLRSVSSDRFIEWQTQEIPSDYKHKRAKFILIAAIDANPDSHLFDFYINGEKYFTIKNPINSSKKKFSWKGNNNTSLEFNATMIDRHGDLMGYMFLDVPVGIFQKGKPLTIKVQGESAGSQSWFIVYKYNPGETLSLFGENAVIREKDKNYQLLRVDIVHLDEPVKTIIRAGNITKKLKLNFGYNTCKIKLPEVFEDLKIPVTVSIGNKPDIRKTFTIKPVKRKTIYLLHHSHVDIGYTHIQKEVEDIHWKYFEEVIEYAKKSRDYPEGARFKWNAEVMWAVDSYLDNAPPYKRAEFINAIKKGWIGLDALYANELTGLCNTEELVRLTGSSRRISKMCGVPLESAMITDVPGWTWGLVPVLARSGVKYISLGTNFGHRIGSTIEKWGDRPFYWVSPSGEEKILCWIHEKAYSMFHTGLDKAALKNSESEKKVFNYLAELDKNNYPYDIVPLRYNIGSDNGPPDPDLAQTVTDWNAKYISPKLVIATTSEMFKAFEKKYGDQIPVVRGDFTPYWEDGAASSAEETAINRLSADKLVQAEVLWTLLDPANYPAEKFEEAWKNVLLYNEHTWGSWNSISEPENDFTISQWEHKKSFALQAQQQSTDLVNSAFNNIFHSSEENQTFEIYNTCSWDRTDLVVLPIKNLSPEVSVSDNMGNISPVQKLSSGEYVFIAKNVPALGSKCYQLIEERAKNNSDLSVNSMSLSNQWLDIELDKISGAIINIYHKNIPVNLVDNSKKGGLNSYFYVKGRKPDNPEGTSNARISIKENGPVLVSLMVESDASGANKLFREVRLISGINRIDIINTIDKIKVYNKEGVHIGFPFNITNGQINLDIAYGVYRPENDQLPGACKNYFTIEDWVDISNQDHGITWASPDAPLIEIGKITTDPVVYGWIDKLKESQTVYSYIMNNYWETNYRAAQEGHVRFRYSIQPHKQFVPSDAEKFGVEQNSPLIAVSVSTGKKPFNSLFTINNNHVINTSVKPVGIGHGYLIKLFNAGGKPEEIEFMWDNKPAAVFISNFDAEIIREAPEKISIPAYGIRIIRAEY